ncbi:MAG: hypothetical protein Q9219_001240 [cf. Caloplaca sp. 3 TL-2023]
MPRVANPPRAQQTPHKQSPLKQVTLFHGHSVIPLNDDLQEKAVRLQSRQALHNLQINQLKAAASPMRKLNNYQRAASDSPKTPRAQAVRDKENMEDGGLAIVANTAATPMKRVPILANFEEWMKMAMDNKINATNSWNFALIDYFHDMSLLKEGDGVNFQKASCTLDGCVKIYTSRVDSVATETGKLLSGLADSGNKKARKEDAEGEAGDEAGIEDEEDGEDGVGKRQRKRPQRASEATLAPSFASIQLKKFELEFSVDPLFKKASADFDEGGAKGLLLNHLSIDAEGRIVFDSSDDANDATRDIEDAEQKESLEEKLDGQDVPVEQRVANIDLNTLGLSYFPDLSLLDNHDICPSLKNLDLGDTTGALDIPLLKAPEDWRNEKNISQDDGSPLVDQTGIVLDEDNVAGFDDDGGLLAGFDMAGDAGFGEGGEAWARHAAIESQIRVFDQGYQDGVDINEEGVEPGNFNPKETGYTVSLHHKPNALDHEDIMSYFDNALQKNWAGPQHWRIRRIKDANKPATSAPARRKEKEPFMIDFSSPMSQTLAELIYTPATSNSAISLPKAQWKSKSRNLLPDDKHFNSRELLRLFLKPKARMGSRKSNFGTRRILGSGRPDSIPEDEPDEAYWAKKENAIQAGSPDDKAPEGNYDANFFQDDGLVVPGGPPDDDDDFADAREAFSPTADGDQDAQNIISSNVEGNQEGAFGTQLVTQSRRLRPEYVQYARVAKKVDVRRLKEEMWKGIGFKETPKSAAAIQNQPPLTSESGTLKFTSVMNDLQQVYPKQAMADISTSYCFICLLHLANEKGLLLGNEPGLAELSIRRDLTAEVMDGAE